jgi:hypothetical protein
MHGLGEILGTIILLEGVLSLLIALVTGLGTKRAAALGFAIALAGFIVLGLIIWRTNAIAGAELPVIAAFSVVGLIGALPGAALGDWLRHKLRKEA